MIIGGFVFASEPAGSDPLHDPPTVNVTAPTGTVTTGGPTLTLSWDFDQPQGDDQEWYRVRLVDDADAITYYDSGWLAGTNTSHVVDIDLVEVPSETSDITTKIQVRGPQAIGTGELARYQAEDLEAFALQYGIPHCTITSPADGSVWTDNDSVDVEWTFTDTGAGGKTQGWYRVRLFVDETGQLMATSRWVESAAGSHSVDYYVQDGSTINIEVQLKNTEGIRSD